MKLFDPHTRALLTSGLVRPVDAFFTGGLVLGSITVLYWRLFGNPTADQMIVVLLSAIVFVLLWTVVLLLRLGVMMLKVRADVNMMPQAAARLAAQIRLGDAPTGKKT